MPLRRRSLVVLMLAAVAVGCTSGAPTATPPGTPAPPSASPPPGHADPTAGLEGTSWRLVWLVGTDLPAGAGITLIVTGDRVSGSGGCNDYGGTYRVDGQRLQIDEVASTLIGCQEPVASREQAFYAALPLATSWEIADGRLILRDADGTDRLVFEPGG